jgi:hypothetical protein
MPDLYISIHHQAEGIGARQRAKLEGPDKVHSVQFLEEHSINSAGLPCESLTVVRRPILSPGQIR